MKDLNIFLVDRFIDLRLLSQNPVLKSPTSTHGQKLSEIYKVQNYYHYFNDITLMSPDGTAVAHVMDNSLCVTHVPSGKTARLTMRTSEALAPRPEACVFSPDGKKLAYVRRVDDSDGTCNQLFVFHLD